MKKIIFFHIMLFSIVFNNAKCQGYISYSASAEYANGENRANHSFGFEVNTFHGFGSFGVFMKDIKNKPVLNLKYNYYLFNSDPDEVFFDIGPGINIKMGEYIGIAPEINVILSASFIKSNLFYKYNLYINHNNTHEFGFTISIIELISTLIMVASH